MGESWTSKAVTMAEAVIWILKLNAWWWALALLGLVVFGAGPATATAAILVRRRGRGERIGFRDAFAVYRKEFVAANVALTPALLVTTIIAGNLVGLSAEQPGSLPAAPALQVVTLAALIFLGAACCFLGPLYAFYQLPRSRYILQAVRITLARPLWAVLMVLISAAIIFAGSKIMILIPFAAVGIWLQVTSWLGLRFFDENEDRRAAALGEPSDDEPLLTLPTEPLRMH